MSCKTNEPISTKFGTQIQYTSEQVIGYNIFENSAKPLFYAHFIEYTFVFVIIFVSMFTR